MNDSRGPLESAAAEAGPADVPLPVAVQDAEGEMPTAAAELIIIILPCTLREQASEVRKIKHRFRRRRSRYR
jgi:hypothetical protein